MAGSSRRGSVGCVHRVHDGVGGAGGCGRPPFCVRGRLIRRRRRRRRRNAPALFAAQADDLEPRQFLGLHDLVARHRAVALHDADAVGAGGFAEADHRAQRPRQAVPHRAAGVQHEVDHPAAAVAARQHAVGAVRPAARRPRVGARLGDDVVDPALQRAFPRARSGVAQCLDRPGLVIVLRGTGPLGRARRGRAHPRQPCGRRRCAGGRPIRIGRAGRCRRTTSARSRRPARRRPAHVRPCAAGVARARCVLLAGRRPGQPAALAGGQAGLQPLPGLLGRVVLQRGDDPLHRQVPRAGHLQAAGQHGPAHGVGEHVVDDVVVGPVHQQEVGALAVLVCGMARCSSSCAITNAASLRSRPAKNSGLTRIRPDANTPAVSTRRSARTLATRARPDKCGIDAHASRSAASAEPLGLRGRRVDGQWFGHADAFELAAPGQSDDSAVGSETGRRRHGETRRAKSAAQPGGGRYVGRAGAGPWRMKGAVCGRSTSEFPRFRDCAA